MNIMEIVVILVVALIVFKPQDLPRIAKWLGQAWSFAKNFSEKLEQQVEEQVKQFKLEENIKRGEEGERKNK